jgi:hypothetical protein
MNSDLSEPLPHRDRSRRVALLCCAFARNVAFHRAGWADEAQPLLSSHHPKASFWQQVNCNFFDMAVLDWCKLFGDQKETPLKRLGKHHWRRVVSDPDEFEARLLAQLETDAERFAALITKMRDYRDTFVAHLDNRLTMNLPEYEAARVAVTFYYRHIVETEAEPGDLAGLPSVDEFARSDGQCTQEAAQVYRINLKAK